MTSLSARRPPRSAPSFSSVASPAPSKPALPPSLVRRLLFPALDETPRLFETRNVPPDLTDELYDLLALALRAYINPWWTKITRYDREFVPEVARILTVVIRALEKRILRADVAQLVFYHVPVLLCQHYSDFRDAAVKVSTSYASSGAVSLPQMFHQLQSHIAVSADGKIEVVYIRQAVDHILKTCLPPEDYDAECERTIVGEIVVKVLIQDVVPKITQPFFIHRSLCALLGSSDPGVELQNRTVNPGSTTVSSRTETQQHAFSLHTFVVAFLSAVQTLSGACLALVHAYRNTRQTIMLVNQSSSTPQVVAVPADQFSPGALGLMSPSIESKLATGRTSPLSRTSSIASSLPSAENATPSPMHSSPASALPLPAPPRDYARPLLMVVSEIFTLTDRFASHTLQTIVAFVLVIFSSFIDRLLPYLLYNHALAPSSLTQIVRITKRTLFPNGYPAPLPPDPTPEEEAAMQQALINAIQEKSFPLLNHLLFGPDPSSTLQAALEPLSSPACNTHLAVLLLDTILLTVFPELGVGGGCVQQPTEPVELIPQLGPSPVARSVPTTPSGSVP